QRYEYQQDADHELLLSWRGVILMEARASCMESTPCPAQSCNQTSRPCCAQCDASRIPRWRNGLECRMAGKTHPSDWRNASPLTKRLALLALLGVVGGVVLTMHFSAAAADVVGPTLIARNAAGETL